VQETKEDESHALENTDLIEDEKMNKVVELIGEGKEF